MLHAVSESGGPVEKRRASAVVAAQARSPINKRRSVGLTSKSFAHVTKYTMLIGNVPSHAAMTPL